MKSTTSIKERLCAPGNVTWVKEWLAGDKGGTRTVLAREMCERLELRDGKGALRMATTLKALRDLEAEGYWRLPAALSHGGKEWNPRRLGHAVAVPQGVPARVELIERLPSSPSILGGGVKLGVEYSVFDKRFTVLRSKRGVVKIRLANEIYIRNWFVPRQVDEIVFDTLDADEVVRRINAAKNVGAE